MKKVLSLVLALVLVLGMIPTFADAHETGAMELKAAGFLKGDDSGDLMVEKELTREEMAVLFAQLNGVEDEAAAFVKPANYTDADQLTWSAPFVSYAQEMGWMIGYEDNSFRPKQTVTGKELLVVLMQVLKYDFTWNTIVADAAAVGLTVSTEGEILRGAAFETMWVGVNTVVNGSDMTLGVMLGKIAPPAPVVVDLALVGVSANNLREVMVEFNNEIDKDSLDKANFMIGTTEATKVVLQADGKTVMAWFALDNQTEYTLEIAEIADVNEFVLEDIEVKFTATDFAAPVVEGVEVFGNKKLVVTFSEPVDPATAQILGNYRINDLLFGGMVKVDGRTVSITVTNRLPEGVHTLKVGTDVTDFAGFKLVSNNTQFAVASDSTAPALATVVSATQMKVVVEFNEPVADTFTVSPSATKVAATGDMKYTLTFASAIPMSGTEITLTDVMDYYGNKATIKFSVIPTLDLARPEVKSVEVTEQNEMVVTFSEEVKLDGTYKLKTVETEPVEIAAPTQAHFMNDDNEKDETKVVLTFTTLEEGDYTLEVTATTDKAPQANAVVPSVTTVTVPDLTVPTVKSIKVTQPTATDAGVAFVEFSEKVDAATALDKANYSYILKSVKPVSLGTSHTLSLLADGKTVKITLPKTADAPVTSITVVNVTDLAANKVTAAVVESPFAGPNVTPISVLTFAPVAVAKNKIEVTVPSNINPNTVTASDFTVSEVGRTTTSIYVINAEYDGKTTITLTLNDDLTAVATYKSLDVDLRLVAKNLADIYGNKVDFGTSSSLFVGTVTDEIVPTATKLASTTWAPSLVTFKVELSEALDNDPILTHDASAFVIVVNNIKYAATASSYAEVDGKHILTVEAAVTPDVIGKTAKLSFFADDNYFDVNGNEMANFEFTATVK